MYKLSRTRIILILLVCLIGIFFAIPNLIKNKEALPSWWQPVNLGLDLQGGSNLLLEVKSMTFSKREWERLKIPSARFCAKTKSAIRI